MQVLDYREKLRDVRDGEERMVVSGGTEQYWSRHGGELRWTIWPIPIM
jgi:hypothetical protein